MNKEIEIVHLNKKYFEENKHFKNMLDENNVSKQIKRPYVYLNVRIEENDFLLPLRSNLNHRNGFHAPSSKSLNAGIDYSHALILPNRSYIKNRSHLDQEQYNYIKDNYETIKKNFSSYLKDYIRKEKEGKAHVVGKFKNSTLLNFNKELGIERKQDKKHKEIEIEKENPTLESDFENDQKNKERQRRLAYMHQMGRER